MRQKYEIWEKRVIFAAFICGIFLMEKRLLCFLSILLLCAAVRLPAQSTVWRVKHLTADSLSFRIDTFSVVPSSFSIQGVDPVQFRLDPLTATIRLMDSSLLGRRLFFQYEVYPFDLSKPVAHKSPQHIEPRRFEHQMVEYPVPSVSDVLNSSELYTNGSVSRGVSVGNNQDLVLNSSLNLQLSGKLSDDVEVMASVTDRNIPVLPEGNTQYLQDISSIFITLKIKQMAVVNAGDVIWRADSGNFLRVSRNMLGLNASVRSEPSAKLRMFNQAGGGIAKGKFARQALAVQTGVQGPYKLYGSDGEISILMVAGSERVYLDGQLLVRGAENDYTIDYNTAEITFTPKRLVSAEQRYLVEFEYSNRHYSRYNLFTHNELEIKGKAPLKLYLDVFHEQDMKNRSIQPELSVDQIRFLSSLGDAGGNALFPYFDSVAFSPDRVLYEKVDTLYNNNIYTIFIFSLNRDSVLYSPDFTYMGPGKGNYRLVSSTANGRVFAWVAPEDGVMQGDYEPVVQLTAPVSQQMVTFGLDFQARKNTRVQTEVALSHFDKNTFSKKDRSDDVGFAYLLNISDVERFASKSDSLPWLLESWARMQFLHKNFAPFESFREVEFARQFNLSSDYAAGRSEWMASAGVSLKKTQRHDLRFGLDFFNRTGENRALRNELLTDNRWNGWRLQSKNSYLFAHDSVQKSRYAVSRVQVAKPMKHLLFSLDNLLEYNVFRDALTDSLRLNSFAFNEVNFAMKSAEKAFHQFMLGYKNRVEFTPDSMRLRHHLTIHEVKAQYRFAQIQNQSFSLNATYRNQSLADSVGKGTPEHYFVGNVQYTGRFFRNALVINTYYETGSGMELRKTFTFIKVAKGQGTHVWNDYNGNGIEELDEFEVSPFPDQAEYVKVWIAGTDYVNAWLSQWTQSVQLRPAAVWGNKTGFRKFLSRFTNILTINASLKHKTRMFVPFASSREDTNLVANRLNIANTFSFNNGNSPFAFDLLVQKNANTQFLYYGLETNDIDYQEVVLKSTPIELLYLQTSLLHKITRNSSTCFESRRYDVEAYSVAQEFRFQFQNRYTASLKGLLGHKRNRFGGEMLTHCHADLSFLYRALNRGTISVSTGYVFMKGDVGQNSTVSYFMLDGMSLGQNLLWTVTGQFSVTQFLQLALQYQGRAMQGHSVIHTGNVTVSAVF